MNLYIYLASRKKEGIKVLEGFPFKKRVYPTKVEDINSLNLTPEMTKTVSAAAHENRMGYELYVESADSFNALKESLTGRGYSHLPMGQFAGLKSSGRMNDKAVITRDNTMLRRRSNLKR